MCTRQITGKRETRSPFLSDPPRHSVSPLSLPPVNSALTSYRLTFDFYPAQSQRPTGPPLGPWTQTTCLTTTRLQIGGSSDPSLAIQFRCQLQAYPVICTSDQLAISQKFPQTPPLVSFARDAHGTERSVFRTAHWFTINGCNSGTARWTGCIRRSVEKGLRVCMPSPGTLLSSHLLVFPNPEALQTVPFGVRMEASLHRYGGLIYWPPAIELSLQPLCLPWWGWGGKV